MFWGRQMSNSQGDKQFQMHHCQDEHAIKCLALAREGRGDEHWQNWLVQLKSLNWGKLLTIFAFRFITCNFYFKTKTSVCSYREIWKASIIFFLKHEEIDWIQSKVTCPLSKIIANKTAAQRRALVRWQHYRAVRGQKKARVFVR